MKPISGFLLLGYLVVFVETPNPLDLLVIAGPNATSQLGTVLVMVCRVSRPWVITTQHLGD